MKRFLTIAGIIVAILVVFFGLVKWKVWSNRPESLLSAIRNGRDKEGELMLKLNLSRGNTVPLLISAFEDENADVEFRTKMLELLFRKMRRSSADERILPVVLQALKNPDTHIRKSAVLGLALYGTDQQRIHLADNVDDPDPQIRKEVYTNFSGRSPWDRSEDPVWISLSAEKKEKVIKTCSARMNDEETPELRFMARCVVGKEIADLCRKAAEAIPRAEFAIGEKYLRKALELDSNSHRARIRLVRHFLAANMKEKALELAEQYKAILHIPLLPEAPKMDGDPTDAVWQHAFRYVGHKFYHSTSHWASKYCEGKNDFYIGHHDGTVYLAILAYENEEDIYKLKVKRKGRDNAAWWDDCVELFFDPANNEADVYQFVINPIGAMDDLYQTKRHENIPCKYGANIFYDRGYWACEFAVAAKDLHGSKITADSIWGMNIFRARIGPASEHCVWWPTYGGAQTYDHFPIAVFDGLE